MQEKNLIDSLVADLLSADPAFKEHEAALRKAIEKMLASKPDVPRDERFFASLRADLIKEFSAQAADPTGIAAFLTKPWFFVPVGALTVAALIVLASLPGWLQGTSNGDLAMENTRPTVGMRVVAASGDFGSLATANGAINPENSPSPTRGLGGGGGGSGAPMAMDASKIAASGSMIVPPGGEYEQFAFVYEYEGEPLVLEETRLPVLRRIKGSGVAASDSIRGMFPRLLDFARFEDLKVQSMSAFEDRSYGMTVYADTLEETVSLSQYYPRWPHPEQACRDQACYEALRLKESDLPSTDAAIVEATAMLVHYGIPLDGYGAPEVRSDWRRWYSAMTDKSQFWFPESLSVVYPMLFGDMRVVDEGGALYGLQVNINVREKRADGVWNLFTRNYESADYDAVTDSAAVLAAARRGGVYGWMPEEGSGVKLVPVRLGTPERVLMRSWQYGSDSQGKELLVPALRFPVLDTNTPNGVPQEAVVIPLAKELFTPADGPGIGKPTPLMIDAVAPSATTTPAPDSAR